MERQTNIQSDADEVVGNLGRWEDDGGQNIGSDYEWLPIVENADNDRVVFFKVNGLIQGSPSHQPRLSLQNYNNALSVRSDATTASDKK